MMMHSLHGVGNELFTKYGKTLLKLNIGYFSFISFEMQSNTSFFSFCFTISLGFPKTFLL